MGKRFVVALSQRPMCFAVTEPFPKAEMLVFTRIDAAQRGKVNQLSKQRGNLGKCGAP